MRIVATKETRIFKRRHETKLLLHEVLFRAIIEIRLHSVSGDTDWIFHLTNLTHNMPRQLARARSSRDYERILREMRARADDHGYDWLSLNFPEHFPPDRPNA